MENDSTSAALCGMFVLMWHVPKFIDKAVDRFGYWYAAWALIGVPVMGLVGAWAGSYSSYLSEFGAIGWIFSGLLSSVLLATLVFLCVQIRNSWLIGRSTRRWIENSDEFNPMESEFRNRRILVKDLAHPITLEIVRKKLYNCELIGPASVFLYNGGYFKDVTFADCSVFVLWPDQKGQVFPGHSVILNNVEMHGGSIYRATILIPPDMVDIFHAMGMKFSTLTGRAEFDTPLKPGTSVGMPPKKPHG